MKDKRQQAEATNKSPPVIIRGMADTICEAGVDALIKPNRVKIHQALAKAGWPKQLIKKHWAAVLTMAATRQANEMRNLPYPDYSGGRK